MPKRKDIDYSDIPETDAAFWAQAEIHMPKRKKIMTIRVDSDVYAWFKEEGRGYQTKINAILRSYVQSHPHRGNEKA